MSAGLVLLPLFGIKRSFLLLIMPIAVAEPASELLVQAFPSPGKIMVHKIIFKIGNTWQNNEMMKWTRAIRI